MCNYAASTNSQQTLWLFQQEFQMDVDLECLLCGKSDLDLYEINKNSVLIGSDLIDFQDIIYDIFNAKVSMFCGCFQFINTFSLTRLIAP